MQKMHSTLHLHPACSWIELHSARLSGNIKETKTNTAPLGGYQAAALETPEQLSVQSIHSCRAKELGL
jgi:hypothetical protein